MSLITPVPPIPIPLLQPQCDQVMNMHQSNRMLLTVADKQLGYPVGFKDIKTLFGQGAGRDGFWVCCHD